MTRSTEPRLTRAPGLDPDALDGVLVDEPEVGPVPLRAVAPASPPVASPPRVRPPRRAALAGVGLAATIGALGVIAATLAIVALWPSDDARRWSAAPSDPIATVAPLDAVAAVAPPASPAAPARGASPAREVSADVAASPAAASSGVAEDPAPATGRSVEPAPVAASEPTPAVASADFAADLAPVADGATALDGPGSVDPAAGLGPARAAVPFALDATTSAAPLPDAALAACAGRVVLVGRTCDLGDDEVNRRIGSARAATVRDALVRAGFDPARVDLRVAPPERLVRPRSAARRVDVHCIP